MLTNFSLQSEPLDESSAIPGGSRTTEKRLSRRLLWRTVAAIAFVAVVLLLVTGWIMDGRLYSQRRDSMHRELDLVRGMIESIMLDSVGEKHYRVHAMLDRFLQDSTYINLWLIGVDTTVLYSRNFSDHVMKLDLVSAPGCAPCHNNPDRMLKQDREYYLKDKRAFHFAIPIKNRAECTRCHDPDEETRAIIVADFSLAQLDEEIWTSRLQLHSFLTFCFLLIVVFTYYLLKSRAYKPLELIAARLRRIAAGEFSVSGDAGQDNIVGFISGQLDRTALRLGGFYSELEAKVSERTQSLSASEKLLAEERDKLSFILNNSPQGIVGLSSDGIILFANEKVGEFVSVSPNNLLGSDISLLPMLSIVVEEFHASVNTSPTSTASGLQSRHWVNCSGRELEVQLVLTGAAIWKNILLVVLTDVTERRQIERNFERHERLASIGQLAAGVAHEIGNPLSAIHSLVQVARQPESPDQASNQLDLISYHVTRISKIVKHLTSLARPPLEEKTQCSINSIVSGAVEIAKYDPLAKNVILDLDLPQQLIEVSTRRDQFMQALLNMILNSFYAVRSRAKPQVSVSVAVVEAICTINITDNGEGIEKANLERIFEPFFTTKPVGKGTGLGLSVTYRIITDLGGSIAVNSDGRTGTTFTIKLPINSDVSNTTDETAAR